MEKSSRQTSARSVPRPPDRKTKRSRDGALVGCCSRPLSSPFHFSAGGLAGLPLPAVRHLRLDRPRPSRVRWSRPAIEASVADRALFGGTNIGAAAKAGDQSDGGGRRAAGRRRRRRAAVLRRCRCRSEPRAAVCGILGAVLGGLALDRRAAIGADAAPARCAQRAVGVCDVCWLGRVVWLGARPARRAVTGGQ